MSWKPLDLLEKLKIFGGHKVLKNTKHISINHGNFSNRNLCVEEHKINL